MLLPWLIGQAFALIGPGSMMFIIAADLILEAIILLAFIYSSRKVVLA